MTEMFRLSTESSLDPDRPFPCDTVEFSGTPFAEFKLITNDCVKEVLQEMPNKSCDLDPIPTYSS